MRFEWTKRQLHIAGLLFMIISFTSACASVTTPVTVGTTIVEKKAESETEVNSNVKEVSPVSETIVNNVDDTVSSGNIVKEQQETSIYRDSTPKILDPSSPGARICGNEVVEIDMSNASEGYITVHYKGTNEKVKFQITGPNGVTYTYDLDGDVDVIPLVAGDGEYNIGCFENISGTEYAIAYTDSVSLVVDNEFGPYLYPNLYVDFDENTEAVALGSELVAESKNDLDAVNAIYRYIVDNIVYDHDFAAIVESGYVPDVDFVLAKKSGICFDYAALMCVMLRSQGIPTRLEVGYAGSAYHAWISTYIEDEGWIDGVIKFDGSSWTLMDPTFAANSEKESFEKFIGDGSNYVTVYVY